MCSAYSELTLVLGPTSDQHQISPSDPAMLFFLVLLYEKYGGMIGEIVL